jgi:diguanylate cyclase (GGDEF)-like protein/PAS domain S-box-containing protein
MKTPPKSAQLTTKELRQRAEAQLKKQTGIKQATPSDFAAKKTLYELQVHQIELEMQNEELKQARITERLHYRFTELFKFAPIAYFAFDLNGIINQVNLRGASLLGIELTNLIGKQFSNYVTVQYRDTFKRCLAKAFVGGGIQSCEVLGQVGPNTFWLNIEANLGITGTDCLVAVIDITQRKEAEYNQKLASEEKEKHANELALAAKVFSHAREGIMISDAKGHIIEVNDTFTSITGYSRAEAIGQNPRILQSGRQSPEFYINMWQAILKEGYWSGEIWNRRKNGVEYAEIKTISAVYDEHGITTHYVALGNDITPMKEHQNQLEHIAHYDILTNLPNRVLLADRLSQAMSQCSRHKQSLAVVFLDLDGFKAVNDAYGHDVGDELLVALSVRMKKALRECDTLSRIGGDEFIAVLANLVTVEDCEPVVERLLLAASEPVTVCDVVLNISASIGVTLYPQDNADTDLLIRHADQAMYMAKELGKNRYHLFDTAQDDAVKVRRESLAAIRNALDTHQFVLYYQPKVNMKTGSVVGFEALIRWQHPKRGLLNPIEFLPVIENNPMMIEMGEWVIDSALTQISQWQSMELNFPVSTSVNIAAVQLQQPDFTDRLTTLLAAHPDIKPQYLELEVLETSALDDVNNVSTTMDTCMALGVKFALDDFGTGYSSLTYLRRLPASLIKIDQSFVRDMLDDADDLAIVEGVIALAKSFKRDVIAEGVETIEHGRALLKLGCDLAQGYGIARPMPASDIPAWTVNWKPDVSWQI